MYCGGMSPGPIIESPSRKPSISDADMWLGGGRRTYVGARLTLLDVRVELRELTDDGIRGIIELCAEGV